MHLLDHLRRRLGSLWRSVAFWRRGKRQEVSVASESAPLAPRVHPIINRETILARSQFFVDVQLWPLKSRLDPEGWLANFTKDEQEHALHLLNAFTYFPAWMVERLFLNAFQSLSQTVVKRRHSFLGARTEWRRFVSSALIIRVTGEAPSEADSGHLFVRIARDQIGISEPHLVSHQFALESILRDPSTPIVFVDDFVGSGQQFMMTWKRPHAIPGHTDPISFSDVASVSRAASISYCSVLCTEFGRKRILNACPNLHVSSAHVIANSQNLLSPQCPAWPDNLRASASNFIERSSARAGIADLNGAVGDYRGFNRLGLAIAFEHGVPDATLPLFTWNKGGWTPLVRTTA